MKALLWLVLAVGVIVNAANSLVFDGATEIAISVCSGFAVVGAITGLVMTRERRS
ncbi:hypothetical protein [Streptomyces sp. NPDC059063]|uniref:hypothetical protein n=1 Tax=unclassified Streptomyces TaxID=2593676 RepID=UPI0036D1E147